MELPPDIHRWNRAMAGVFKKGMAAHQNGQPITDCPYEDKRKWDGRLTFSRAFVKSWANGWQWADGQKEGVAPLQGDQSWAQI